MLVRPKAGHPRPAGRSRPRLARPARLRGARGTRRAGHRSRARGAARRRGARALVERMCRAAARQPADRELRDRDRRAAHRHERAAPAHRRRRLPRLERRRDAALALERLGAEPCSSGTPTASSRPSTAVVLPGGFSYGDYLRCGAIARFAPVMAAVAEFARDGGPVLGICNGFQILCEAGLLPGRPSAERVAALRLPRRRASRRAEPTPRSPRGARSAQRLVIPVKHGEGC